MAFIQYGWFLYAHHNSLTKCRLDYGHFQVLPGAHCVCNEPLIEISTAVNKWHIITRSTYMSHGLNQWSIVTYVHCHWIKWLKLDIWCVCVCGGGGWDCGCVFLDASVPEVALTPDRAWFTNQQGIKGVLHPSPNWASQNYQHFF